MATIQDTRREVDKNSTFGNVWANTASPTDYGNGTFIKFEGTTEVTLRDDDWVTPSPAPTVIINGSNNIINQNTYNDNRVYVNSFNVSDSYNQTYVNSFNGSGGKDSITGTTQSDQITGLQGNDVLRGAQGNDNIIGGQGNDQIFGGLGRNILDGGKGTDIYNVATETNAAQADILKGFTATDRINIIGATNLTFQSMQDGIGIFNNGTLQSLVTGNVGLDAVRNATSAI
jgi:Ca2+-binding RTX toxin-like protein